MSYTDIVRSFSVLHVYICSEVHKKALLQLLRLCESPEKYNWKRHCNKVLHILMEQIQGRNSEVKGLALAALREVIKIEPQVLNNVTELIVTKVFKSCRDPEVTNLNIHPKHLIYTLEVACYHYKK